MALAKGTRLGPYEVVGALGAGGMGEVFNAQARPSENSPIAVVLDWTAKLTRQEGTR